MCEEPGHGERPPRPHLPQSLPPVGSRGQEVPSVGIRRTFRPTFGRPATNTNKKHNGNAGDPRGIRRGGINDLRHPKPHMILNWLLTPIPHRKPAPVYMQPFGEILI